MRSFLTIILLIGFATVNAQLTYAKLLVQYDSAISFRNLKLIPVIQKGQPNAATANWLTLQKAIETGQAVISERGTASTENVHFLRINNKSDLPILVGAGEVILGGRQDRMVTRDTLLWPTGKNQYISVMCVEEDRWSDKEKKFSYLSYANTGLRKVLQQHANQVLIWKEVYRQLDSSRIKAPTLSYAGKRLDKKVQPELEAYRNFFHKRIRNTDSAWTGMIVVSGNRVIGAEIFESPHLFYDSFDALLQAYAEEAVWEGAPPVKKDEAVRNYIEPALKNEASQLEFLKEHGKLFRYLGRPIHLTLFGEH